MKAGGQVVAYYGKLQGILGVFGLIVGFPAFVFQTPLIGYADYAAYLEHSRYGYAWIGLCLVAPISVIAGVLLLTDMIRFGGRAIFLRGGLLSIGGPVRWTVNLADLERVELSKSPRGVRLWWRPERSRAIASILINQPPEEIRQTILALLAEAPP